MPKRRNQKKKKAASKRAKTGLDANERHIVTLFADIVGCSEISNHKNLREYNQFLSEFQKCFTSVCKHYKNLEYEKHEHNFFKEYARGDEGVLMIFVSKDDDSLARDIDVAIKIAIDLKRKWLFTEDNIARVIDDGLLPVDLAIGIHAGKVFVNEEKGIYRPEGYAINLAKRIESESRNGKFTHILLSESARGHLFNLKDESIYKFDRPFNVTPKGISRNIKVFEIKHHFLPTNWNDSPSEVSIVYDGVDKDKLDVARKAYEINPTNLWLAEEYLLLSVIHEYKELEKQGKESDASELKNSYNSAIELAQRIANTELRDAGLLSIWGFIAGERLDYAEEQKRYNEALDIDEQDGDIYWYLALSKSYQIDDEYKARKKSISISDYYNEKELIIDGILKDFERAIELKPMHPWFQYDFACELSRWSVVKSEYRKKSIDMLISAFGLNSYTKENVKSEPFLKPIVNDSKIKQHLQ